MLFQTERRCQMVDDRWCAIVLVELGQRDDSTACQVLLV